MHDERQADSHQKKPVKGYLIGGLVSLTGLFAGSIVGVIADDQSGELILRYRDEATGLLADNFPLYMFCRRVGLLAVALLVPAAVIWGRGYKLRNEDGDVRVDFRMHLFGLLFLIFYLAAYLLGNEVTNDLDVFYAGARHLPEG